MNFIVVSNDTTLENPSMADLPEMIASILETSGGPIDFFASSSDVTEEDFKTQVITPLRRAMKQWGYTIITATKDHLVVKPLMFHIPGKEHSTLKFTEYETSISIEKVPMEEAIERMSENDITVNEVFNDVIGLRPYKEYQEKLNKIKDTIEESKQVVHETETKSVKELLNL